MEMTKSQLGSGNDIDAFVVYFYTGNFINAVEKTHTDIRCVNNADTDEAFKVKKRCKTSGVLNAWKIFRSFSGNISQLSIGTRMASINAIPLILSSFLIP